MSAPLKIAKKEFESPSRYEENNPKPAPVVGFRFLEQRECQKSAKMKYIDYRPAKLVKGKKRWYVEYYYRIPAELRPLFKNRVWERKRVFEDINRVRTDEYAAMLVEAVNRKLEAGFNPFEDLQKNEVFDYGGETKLSIKDAFDYFQKQITKKGLDKETVSRYTNVSDIVYKWFVKKDIYNSPIEKVRKKHIEAMLSDLKESREWSNRQYNNYKGYTFTIFETLKKGEVIKENPCKGVEKLKQTANKHRYYDEKTFSKITKIIQANDPYLWLACQFVYYLGIRSGKELRLLKVGDIQGDVVRFRAEVSKSDREDYVPIDPNLKKVIEGMNLEGNDNYVFGVKHEPSPVPLGLHYFSKRFAKIREMAGLDSSFTCYSFKHTRAVHLIKAGVKLSDISRLFRHTDIATTAKYIRDLGQEFDAADLISKSRKI